MKRAFQVMLVCGVLVASLAVTSSAWAAKTVCPSGCSYTGIQAAINAASPGATITIGPGSYTENVVVNKPVTLKGSGSSSTVIYPAVSNPVCARRLAVRRDREQHHPGRGQRRDDHASSGSRATTRA